MTVAAFIAGCLVTMIFNGVIFFLLITRAFPETPED